MSDIYEHKARKYIYKYKILKQEYIGGAKQKLDCIKSPPISLTG